MTAAAPDVASAEVTAVSLFPGSLASVPVDAPVDREMPGLWGLWGFWYWVLLWAIFTALGVATLTSA